jgi:hypothetical protein
LKVPKAAMNAKIILGVVVMITLGTTIGATTMLLQQADAIITGAGPGKSEKAPPAITGDNVYVAWWTNKTGNDEVLFRASNDKGQTFGDKINLSNTTDADSTRVEIDSDDDSVVVTWWETNETSDTPVMKVSNDFGKTFGPLLKLAGNGTIASGEVEPLL